MRKETCSVKIYIIHHKKYRTINIICILYILYIIVCWSFRSAIYTCIEQL